jgi:1-deoxy-D-xylulose-5-phosphate synthase
MPHHQVLDRIQSPDDLKKLEICELRKLADELREELLDVVSTHGGHLASNLGVVELTIALLRAFRPPRDKIVWDTGHQAYIYKLLTGRRELFQKLREDNGCCGFLHREESEFDVFGAGHAGTAISAATGLAFARDRSGENHRVLAVLGDGALGCGSSLEGLNNVAEKTDDMIIVINDNRMSISANVGALSRYLTRVISGQRYNQFKRAVTRIVERIPLFGKPMRRLIHRLGEGAKGVLVPGMIFEELGLRYIGPLDGHDLEQMIRTFERLARLPRQKPLLVHVITRKGAGFAPAEKNPEIHHGLGPFDRETGADEKKSKNGHDTFSGVLGDNVRRLLDERSDTVAITAGMCGGTGLDTVRQNHPDRLLDVGIAEEHAVLMAGGMAVGGLRPIVAIYATFMQRAQDYVFHDICLQNLPVIFCLDRAGVVPDGPTHHGIHDLGFWQSIPNLIVLQPADGNELTQMLDWAVAAERPCVIRYPRSSATSVYDRSDSRPTPPPLELGRAHVMRNGDDVALVCLGREVATGLQVADKLETDGIQAAVLNARFVQPLDVDTISDYARRMPLVTIEDHCVDGGLGTRVADALADTENLHLLKLGWPNQVIPFGTIEGLRSKFGLDIDSVAERVRAFLR